MKKKHQQEIEKHVQQHNDKYNELMKQKMLMEDKLKSDFEKEKSKLLAKYEKLMQESLRKAGDDDKGKNEKIFASMVYIYIYI